MKSEYKITVVIAKSRESYKKTLDSLKGQICDIIVVDGSNGLSHARNEGINKAKGDYLCFLDDDVIVHPNYIRDVQFELKRSEADILGGLVLPLGDVPRWFPSELHSMLAINPISKEIFGCNFVVKKDVFSKLNFKFDVNLGRKKGNLAVGEESELLFLAKKNKMKIFRSNSAIVYHEVTPERRTYYYFVRRVFWEGRSEIKRKRFIKHFILGILSLGLSLIRWVIYASSFVYYFFGAFVEFCNNIINARRK